MTSTLPPGDYSVTASARQNLVAYLTLHVPKQSKERDPLANAFSYFLMPLAQSQYPTFIQTLRSVESLPVTNHLAEFRGIVIDQSGSAITGVGVDIVRKGTGGQNRVAHLMTDNLGRFSKKLEDGVYVALFAASGFNTKPVLFERSPRGRRGKLSVVLQVAGTS